MQHLTLPSGATMPVIGLGKFEQLPGRERDDMRAIDGINRGQRLFNWDAVAEFSKDPL